MCLIAQKAAENSKNVAVKYAEVHAKLKKDPDTIEEVVEMEELVKDIPKQTGEIQGELDEMLAQFEVLDKFAYQLGDDEFSDKWNAYGWPKKIEESVQRVEEAMLAKRESFKSEQEREQEDFLASIDSIELVVGDFHQHTDVNNLEAIAAQAREVSAKLADYSAKAKLFNAREILYGEEQTDYDKLSRITKQFEPYAQLWIGVDDWRRWHVEWTKGDFFKLEPEQMENDLQNTWRNLFKASKALSEHESISNLALSVRSEIDDFKPIMPIVTALRNPGVSCASKIVRRLSAPETV
jgi:dynein heavy chain